MTFRNICGNKIMYVYFRHVCSGYVALHEKLASIVVRAADYIQKGPGFESGPVFVATKIWLQ